jgi:FkbM family methyltransferase
MKVFFQIGTNTGNDRFRELVKQHSPDRVILVEPNTALIPEIKKQYEGVNVHIYANAVYYRSQEPIELYIPAKNGVMGTKADNQITYGHEHFSLLPMNDWGQKQDMVKLQATSITFEDICTQQGITTIDYLQMDTEGFDSEIIKMIDLSKYTIRQIRFEKWRFPADQFTDYHPELSQELGKNGLENSIHKLKQHRYTIVDVHDQDGDDLLATLSN